MGIAAYIREIGRGREGARSLDRAQAADLFGQVLDGSVTDLEVGAFCLAMRIKGETPEEMAGFLDATLARIARVPVATGPAVVLPSYNGARRQPVLTPLLALVLARHGLPVLIHGTPTESGRLFAGEVLRSLDIAPRTALTPVAAGEVAFVPTGLLHPGLRRLLEVRRVVGLRNPAHSLVKLLDPCDQPSVLVGCYTHPEYAVSMAGVLGLMHTTALLLRGTEGEPVADARRLPVMEGFVRGQPQGAVPGQAGSIAAPPDLPAGQDAAATAGYTRAVLAGELPLPEPLAAQVEHILRLARTS